MEQGRILGNESARLCVRANWHYWRSKSSKPELGKVKSDFLASRDYVGALKTTGCLAESGLSLLRKPKTLVLISSRENGWRRKLGRTERWVTGK